MLTQSAVEATAEERRSAAEHASACWDCQAAVEAVHRLRAEGLTPAPNVRAGALERVLAAAPGAVYVPPTFARPFWTGIGVGAGLAALLTIGAIAWLVQLGPLERVPSQSATPQITMALNERRDIRISLTSPEPLIDAQIHVVLSGGIELGGFEGQRELRWQTDLDRGVNQLRLPIVALAAGTGQLLVEVGHGDRRRTFVVDVRTS
jgi:hypothetical protein